MSSSSSSPKENASASADAASLIPKEGGAVVPLDWNINDGRVAYWLRCVGTFGYLFSTMPILYALTPLRLTHYLFRMLGFPNHWLPLDVVSTIWSKVLLKIAQLDVVVEGDGFDPTIPTVFMFNHQTAIDPFIPQSFSQFCGKFVFKRELIWQPPFLGLLLWAYGHVAINRSNRESAIKSLNKAGRKLKKLGRSTLIFPEGTRSRNGQLLPFKKGAFHVAKTAGVSATPVVLLGAYELWKPGTAFPNSGTVVMRILPPIDTSEHSVEELMHEVRTAMEKSMADPPRTSYRTRVVFPVPALMFLSSVALLLYKCFA